MEKKIILVFIILSFNVFGLDYENDFKKARELSWDKKYSEAQELYKDLLNEFQSQEIAISYSNMLAWQEKYEESIEILKKYVLNMEIRDMELAKIYLWKGDENKAYKKYIKLKKQGVNIGKQAEEFIEDYDSKKDKFQIKYIYSADITGDLEEEVPQLYLSYKKDDKLTFVLSREWNMTQKRDTDRIRNQGEIYYNSHRNSHRIFFGNSTIENFFIGDDLDFKWILLGGSYTQYNNSYKLSSVVQKSFQMNTLKLNFTQKVTLNYIKDELKSDTEINTTYMSELKYKEWLQYRQYYNLESENKGNLKLIINNLDYLLLEFGIYNDFKKDIIGYDVGVGINF
ncbi:MAG: tetratricopeptide repeat protein [Fusobacteriota bacterium]